MPEPTVPDLRTAAQPEQGDLSAVEWWKVSERIGGWDVVGLDARDEIAFECLHLHAARADGVACGRRLLPETKGPSR